MTWARPPRVTCVTRQKSAWDGDYKSDLGPIYDRAERHTRQPSDLRTSYEDLRPRVELVDFNGEEARVIASIQE